MSAVFGLLAVVALAVMIAAISLAVREGLERAKPAPKWKVDWKVARNGDTFIYVVSPGGQQQLHKRLREGHDPVEFDAEMERAQEVCNTRNRIIEESGR